MGDFNDRYNGLGSELKLNLNINGVETEVKLDFKGSAPKSCCYNWDSSCKEGIKPTIEGLINQDAQTCTVPNDVVLAGPNNPDKGKLRKSMGDEGLLENYKYTGDYCFAHNSQSELQIYTKQNRIVSTESDHELVYLNVNITRSPPPTGAGKPTLYGGSKKRRAKKSFKKMHKRKHSMKKHRKSRK